MQIALLLSGGVGTRLASDIPKQYIEAGGRPIISYCIRRLSSHSGIDGLQIVADPSWQGRIEEWLRREDLEKKFRGFSKPGRNRQLSILHGLEDIREYADASDSVLIHDAARPLLSERQLFDCLEAATGHDGAIPVLPMKDTVYLSENGNTISALLNRSQIFAGQAPEVFRLGAYYEANRRLLPDKILEINGSTEPAILAGMDIAMFPGDEGNFKITTQADLERFQRILAQNVSLEP